MTEAEGRNTRGFDLTTTSPLQAAAVARFTASRPAGVTTHARAVRGQPGRRLFVSERRGRSRLGRGPQQLPAAHRRHLQAGRSRGAPRRLRRLHLAVPDPGRARPEQRAQSDRLLAQHAGAGDERRRPDLQRQPEQPGTEQHAARADRLEPGPGDESRRQPRHGLPDRAQEPDVLALQLRHRARAARRHPRRALVPRTAGPRPAARRAAELRAAGRRGRRARSATTPRRRSSRRRSPTRSRAFSPTTRASAAPPSRAGACCSPIRTSTG